ncbi:MAG TPA: tetratricopeptide repeat protein, partial [Pyrinomonadaceae bacterium]|nr:tetratricopeptide repeat protein [Pyrinomonadaceae bacterium]
ESAMKLIDDALKIDPNYAEAYYYRGATNNRAGNPDQAVSDYQRAVFVDASYTDASFDLATTQYNQERYAQSAESYRKTIAIDDTNGEAHANLAESYRQLEQFSQANTEYATASEYIKDDPEMYSSWGYCLGKEGNWEKASERLDTAADMRGDAVDFSNIAWAENHAAEEDIKAGREADAAKNLGEARDASTKATELNPNLASAFVNLGTSLNGLKDYDNASVALQRAVTLHDDWYFAHNELGRSLRGLGKLAEAIATFQRVVTINDQFAYGFYNLGEAQYASGDKKGAEKTMKALRKLNPDLAGQLDGVLKGKIDAEKRKVEQKIKNKIPKIPF